MKQFVILSVGVFFVACSAAPEVLPEEPLPPVIDSSQASSTDPEPMTTSDLSAKEVPYMGPFHETERGEMIGTITLTGYPMREEVCNDDSWDEQCSTYATYVFFKISEGMTPTMEAFLERHQGNAFVREGAVGLGCETNLEKNPTMAPVLAASADAQVTITLNRPFEPAGRGVPSCFSHFDVLAVGAR